MAARRNTCRRAAAAAQDAERSKTERRLKKQLAAANKIAESIAPLEGRVAELEALVTQSADARAALEVALAEATQREQTALAETKAAATAVASLRAGEGSGDLLRASKSGRRAMVALARAEKQLGLSGSEKQASDWSWLTNRLGASPCCAWLRVCAPSLHSCCARTRVSVCKHPWIEFNGAEGIGIAIRCFVNYDRREGRGSGC